MIGALDGIPNGCDLCPTIGGAYDAHHVQADDDHDGVGNACDLCPAAGTDDQTCCNTNSDCTGKAGWDNRCIPVVAGGVGASCLLLGHTGRCATSNDFDGDHIGDKCDSCPTTIQYLVDDTDSDTDGVADACDSCPGTHPYGHQTKDEALPCSFDPKFGGAGCIKGVCNYTGHCTGGKDTDLDGIGDACDGCTQMANPQGSQVHSNCTIDTERVIGAYPYKTDECDPNPCTYSYMREPTTTAIPSGEIIWNLVDYRAFTLPNNYPGAYEYKQPHGTLPPNGVPTATTGGRFCYCDGLAPGMEMTAYNCRTVGCAINSVWYNDLSNPLNPWTGTQMMQLDDAHDVAARIHTASELPHVAQWRGDGHRTEQPHLAPRSAV